MQILYVDASGDPGQYMGSNTAWYIVAGVAFDHRDWRYISGQFYDMLADHFSGDPPEIHTKELLRGREAPYVGIDVRKLCAEICALIVESDLTLFAIAIDKMNYVVQIGPPTEFVTRSVEEIVNRYHIYLQRKREMGIIVSDTSAVGFDNRIRELYEYFRRAGTRFVKVYRIIDTIFFTPSQTAFGIQLADFVAYAVKRYCEDDDSTLFDAIKERFDSYEGEIHGFRILPYTHKFKST